MKTPAIDFTVDTSICTCNVSAVNYDDANAFVLMTKKVTVDTSSKEGHTKGHETCEDGAVKTTYTLSKHGFNCQKATSGSKCTSKFGSCAHVCKDQAFKASNGTGTVTTLMLCGTTIDKEVCKSGTGGEATVHARQDDRPPGGANTL